MPELVRPHLMAPTRATVEITPSNVDEFVFEGPRGPLQVAAQAAEQGAWVLSSHTVDASGRTVETITGEPSLSPTSGPCAPPEEPPAQQADRPGRGSRTLPGRAHPARLPAAGDLPARQPLLALAVARDRDLHRARPRPLRVLLLVAPPPRLLTTPQRDRPGENPGHVGLVRDADPDRLRVHQTQRLRARRTATRSHSYLTAWSRSSRERRTGVRSSSSGGTFLPRRRARPRPARRALSSRKRVCPRPTHARALRTISGRRDPWPPHVRIPRRSDSRESSARVPWTSSHPRVSRRLPRRCNQAKRGAVDCHVLRGSSHNAPEDVIRRYVDATSAADGDTAASLDGRRCSDRASRWRRP